MPTCLLSLSVSQGLGSNTENRMKGGRDDSSMVQQEDSISCSVFLLQLSLFSPTVVAAVAQGIGRSHHRHSNVVLNIVLPWLWEVARSGVQDSGNIQNLSGVLRWSWHVLTATHQSQTKEAALQDIARWLTNADSIASRMSRTSQPSSPRDYISLIYIYIVWSCLLWFLRIVWCHTFWDILGFPWTGAQTQWPTEPTTLESLEPVDRWEPPVTVPLRGGLMASPATPRQREWVPAAQFLKCNRQHTATCYECYE